MGACAPCCVWALNDVRGSPRWLRRMSLIFSALARNAAWPRRTYVRLCFDRAKKRANYYGLTYVRVVSSRAATHVVASTNPARGLYCALPPTNAPQPPSGEHWVHEIKHDGFRVIARKIGKRVRLYSRPGNDLTYQFPLIVMAVAQLGPQSCIIDGEAVVLRGRRALVLRPHSPPAARRERVPLCVRPGGILDGDDLRREPLAVRKATLTQPAPARDAGPAVQRAHGPRGRSTRVRARMQARGRGHRVPSDGKLALIRSDRSPNSIKSKNPNAPAVRREAEEDWGR